MSIGAGLAFAVALGRMVAGCGASSFTCESDVACAGLPEGRCEPSGYCSIPDEDCASKRRYAEHSGELSSRCVGDEGTGSSSASASTGEGSPPLDGATTRTDGSTSGDGSTSTPVDPTDPTDGPLPTPCGAAWALVDEPFEAFPLDPEVWDVDNAPGVAVNVTGGELRLMAIDAVSGSTSVSTRVPWVGSAGAELTLAPDPEVPGEAYVVLSEFETIYGFHVYSDTVDMFYDDGFDYISVQNVPYDPVEHRWLRMVFDSEIGSIAWETSPDGSSWAPHDELELEPGFELGKGTLDVGAAVWDGPITVDPLATFGHAFVCEG